MRHVIRFCRLGAEGLGTAVGWHLRRVCASSIMGAVPAEFEPVGPTPTGGPHRHSMLKQQWISSPTPPRRVGGFPAAGLLCARQVPAMRWEYMYHGAASCTGLIGHDRG